MYYKRTPQLDTVVRERLRKWPHQPPGLQDGARHAWLRGRPDVVVGQCFLKQPGSDRLRTIPDGLWLSFGGTPAEPYADIFVIEACASLSNLQDKRSRFAPSTQSLMAVCPMNWLMSPVIPGGDLLRWQATGVLPAEPTSSFVLPVRGVRVMYGLQKTHYENFARYQVPHAHEFFVPMEALTAANGDHDPAMRALVARAAVSANFLAPNPHGAAPPA